MLLGAGVWLVSEAAAATVPEEREEWKEDVVGVNWYFAHSTWSRCGTCQTNN